MQKNKLDYRWVIAAVCFLIIFTALGFCSSTKALFLKPVTDTLGISRSLFSITDSIRHVTNAVLSLFFGNLVMKFGTKKLACAGLLCLCTAPPRPLAARTTPITVPRFSLNHLPIT